MSNYGMYELWEEDGKKLKEREDQNKRYHAQQNGEIEKGYGERKDQWERELGLALAATVEGKGDPDRSATAVEQLKAVETWHERALHSENERFTTAAGAIEKEKEQHAKDRPLFDFAVDVADVGLQVASHLNDHVPTLPAGAAGAIQYVHQIAELLSDPIVRNVAFDDLRDRLIGGPEVERATNDPPLTSEKWLEQQLSKYHKEFDAKYADKSPEERDKAQTRFDELSDAAWKALDKEQEIQHLRDEAERKRQPPQPHLSSPGEQDKEPRALDNREIALENQMYELQKRFDARFAGKTDSEREPAQEKLNEHFASLREALTKKLDKEHDHDHDH